MSRYAAILAGGRGERFWPVSRGARPKPFVDLFGGKALLRHAVDRLNGIVPKNNILVVTSADLVGAMRKMLPDLPKANIVGEPVGRDTAAACALATELVAHRGDASASLAILTADQLMDAAPFRRTLRDAFAVAESAPCLVTLGISPTLPSTGFGYIERGSVLTPPRKDIRTEFHKVKRFVEKPDVRTAEGYLKSGRYFWNSGMFVWRVATFRKALSRHCPALAVAMSALSRDVGRASFAATLKRMYAGLERISVDYAIMEKADNLVVATGAFGWDDVGTWTAAAAHLDADGAGNAISGCVEIMEGKGNVVVSDTKHLVALYGMSDVVVVHSRDATLVCPKSRAQELKELVRRIGARKDGERFV